MTGQRNTPEPSRIRGTIEELIRAEVLGAIQAAVQSGLIATASPIKEWVSTVEAAQILGVQRHQVTKWLRQGSLVRMDTELSGRRVLISMESIRRIGKDLDP